MEHWYSVKRLDIAHAGGRGLFRFYTCVEDALRAIYPEFAWESWRFAGRLGRGPAGLWADQGNLLDAITRAEAKLAIQQVRMSNNCDHQ